MYVFKTSLLSKTEKFEVEELILRLLYNKNDTIAWGHYMQGQASVIKQRYYPGTLLFTYSEITSGLSVGVFKTWHL